MVAVLFWLSVLVVLYVYAGYLFALVARDSWLALRGNARFLGGRVDRRTAPAQRLPRVSVLIAAHDEASCIREKIENTLALDYPADQLEILVGSDGSTDGTDDIVRGFAHRGVRLSAAARGGKVAVLNRLAGLATGDVWLFTDANTQIERGALRHLVRPFSRAEVGGVCGRLRLVTPEGAPAGEGLYWKYENLLKFYESRCGALMGANGGLYALRREEWEPLAPDTIVDDFMVTMRVLMHGRLLVYEPSAVAEEETASELHEEARRRVRIATGNFQSLRTLAPLLRRPDFVGFAFWSHKVLRWVAPFFLALAFAANLLLVGHGAVYSLSLIAQLLFLLAAVAPTDALPAGARGPARLCRYFLEMNVSLVRGLVRFLTTRPSAAWQRTARAPMQRAA